MDQVRSLFNGDSNRHVKAPKGSRMERICPAGVLLRQPDCVEMSRLSSNTRLSTNTLRPLLGPAEFTWLQLHAIETLTLAPFSW
jgi:hypothetical protein